MGLGVELECSNSKSFDFSLEREEEEVKAEIGSDDLWRFFTCLRRRDDIKFCGGLGY